MLNNNKEFIEILKAIAISLDAKSVSLVNNKEYRFYLHGEKVLNIPKKEVEIEFLKQVKIDVIQ